MTVVTPLRFVAGVIGLWIAGRIVLLVPDLTGAEAEADVAAERPQRRILATLAPPPATPPMLYPSTTQSIPAARPQAPPIPHRARARFAFAGGNAAPPPAVRIGGDAAPERSPAPPDRAVRLAAIDPAPSPTGIVPPRENAPASAPPAATASRWSGSLYLYRRGDGDAGLASGGQLGGSQAGARIAYRLNATGPARFAAAARLSAPLNDRHGAEAAAGLDWHPLPGRPLRVSVERRFDIGGAGRDAWSAYAAGGFWREVRPGIVVEGYAQAGIVGARRGDLFADGALRAGHRHGLGGGRALTVGGGVWGAAQPRVERVDIGPRVALGLPLAGSAATLAAEWRVRVAGDASPRSGLALTLAADF